MINFDEIIINQHGLRDPQQLPAMIEFIGKGGVFDRLSIASFCEPLGIECSYKIYLTRFPDSKIHLHEGHHRAFAIYKAGRNWLEDSEYEIKDYTYEDYMRINLSVNFVTPFDPRYQVRKSDFLAYKNDILETIKTMKDSNIPLDQIHSSISKIIKEKSSLYRENRIYSHIRDILSCQTLSEVSY